jgi:hypothetical protein
MANRLRTKTYIITFGADLPVYDAIGARQGRTEGGAPEIHSRAAAAERGRVRGARPQAPNSVSQSWSRAPRSSSSSSRGQKQGRRNTTLFEGMEAKNTMLQWSHRVTSGHVRQDARGGGGGEKREK